LLGVGFFMANVESPLVKEMDLYQMHKSFGITLLFLVLVRIYWRKNHTPPNYPQTVSQSETKLANVVSYLLYALMVLMPLAGWAMSSSTPPEWKTMFFGLFEWPRIPGLVGNTELKELFKAMHFFGAIALVTLIALHLAGTIKHLVIDKENLLKRIWFK
ncbi:MAG: cytochrome b, partial [Alphaproteobacteria bacterium]